MINPLLKSWRHLFIYNVIWMMFAGFISIWWWMSFACPLWLASLVTFPSVLVFGCISFSAYYVCRSQSMESRKFNRTALVYGIASMIAGFIFWLIMRTMLDLSSTLVTDRIPESVSSNGFIFALIGLTLYLSNLLVYDSLQAFDKIRVTEQRESAAQLFAREAELHALRSQIDPHFLFNSLNSISALTTIDPRAARDMTLALSEFFRLSLTSNSKNTVSVREELNLCEQFLRVEKFRYGDKLHAKIEVADDALDCPIPSMLLQPLFENAIKHGIRGLSKGGSISLAITRADGKIHICMSNPIPLKRTPSEAQDGTGTGLRNIHQRCHVLYGKRAAVHTHQHEQTFTLEITLPDHHDE